jgi:hypothetical protein
MPPVSALAYTTLIVSPTPMELLTAGIPLTLVIDVAFGVNSEGLDQVSASPELAGTRSHAAYLDPQANTEFVEAAMARDAARHGVHDGTGRPATLQQPVQAR